MRKLLIAIPLALMSPMTAMAQGHIGTRNVASDLRTTLIVLPQRRLPTVLDLTPGKDGVIVSAALNEGSTAAGTSVVITTIDTFVAAAFLQPARVLVTLIDTGTDSTLACTSAVVYGFNQFGDPVSETITTIDETPVTNSTAAKSLNAYERITRVTATGCSGGETTTDRLRVVASQDLGLPYRITSSAAVQSICIGDPDGTVDEAFCYVGAASDATGSPSSPNVAGAVYAFDNAGTGNRVSIKYHTLNLLGLSGYTFAENDSVLVRIRAPAGVK